MTPTKNSVKRFDDEDLDQNGINLSTRLRIRLGRTTIRQILGIIAALVTAVTGALATFLSWGN